MVVEPSDFGKTNGVVPEYAPISGGAHRSNFGTTNVSLRDSVWRSVWRVIGGTRVPLVYRGGLTAKQRRNQLVPGSFFPDESTTGLYQPTTSTVTTNLTITEANAHYEDVWFRCRVDVRTTGVTFKNCKFTGPADSALENGIIVATNAAVAGLLLEDCTIAPEHTSHTTNCIEGHHFTLRRVNSYHGVDLCSVIAPADFTRADVVVEGSWLHDPAMYNTPVQADNLTHNDVIQWHGMKGLTVNGSRLEGLCAPGIGVVDTPPVGTWPTSLVSGNPFYPNRWATSVVMASPPRAAFDDFVFTNNWLDGAAAGLVLTHTPPGPFDDCGTITGNRFGYDWRNGPDFGVLAKAAQTMTLEGNVRWNKADPWDVSIPFNVRNNG